MASSANDRRVPMLLTLATFIVLVTACGSSAPAAPSIAEESPVETAAATATPAPTPTPALSADERLHAYLADRRQFLSGTFTATYEAADGAWERTGTYVARGNDFAISATHDPPGLVTRTDQLLVAGSGFQRQDEGRWYTTENIYLDGGLAALVDQATWDEEIRPGWYAPDEIDLLKLASAIGALPANLTIDGSEQVEGEVLAQIGPNGDLEAMEIALTITSTLAGAQTVSDWSFAFSFDPQAELVRLVAPDDAWRQEFLADAMAMVELPSSFERQPDGMYVGPDATWLYVTTGPTSGLTPEENYAGLVAFFTSAEGWGTPAELDEQLTVGGDVVVIDGSASAPEERPDIVGRLIAAHFMMEDTELYGAKAIIQHNAGVYVLHWIGAAFGDEADQLALFREIASTFTPLQ